MRGPLWAPWRMEYILGDKKGPCVFCGYAAASAEDHAAHHVLASEASGFVCLNRYPFASGHLLVVPPRHVSDVGDLTEPEYDGLMRLVRRTVAVVRAALRPEGVNVGMNLGVAAGAGIADHLHVHVVPRWGGDTNFMPVLADVRVMPQHLDETYRVLAPFFREGGG